VDRGGPPHVRPHYQELPPDPALAALAACCWSFEIPDEASPFRHAIIPDGTVSLVLVHRRAPPVRQLMVTRPCATARWITVAPGDTFQGVRLLPGASSALLGIPPHALSSHSQPLADLDPLLARSLLEALATAKTAPQMLAAMMRVLEPLAARSGTHDAIIRHAVARVRLSKGADRIGHLAQEAGISERQLRRKFRAEVGLTPKELSRAIRVRAACIRLALSPHAPLAAIAHDAGYADQSHFCRELSEVFGSPARAIAALLRSYSHGRFAECA
jgi:AraC-like DNA-binding protein